MKGNPPGKLQIDTLLDESVIHESIALLSYCLAAISRLFARLFQQRLAEDVRPNELRRRFARWHRSKVDFALRDGVPTYSVSRFGRTLIGESRLGFCARRRAAARRQFHARIRRKRCSLSRNLGAALGRETRKSTTTTTSCGVALQQAGRRWLASSSIVFRVFDDGVGFRYEWPEQPNLDDISSSPTSSPSSRSPRTATPGGFPPTSRSTTSTSTRKTHVSELKKAHTPATFEIADGTRLSIHEAALVDFASMTLAGDGSTTLKADLVPWSDGVKVRADRAAPLALAHDPNRRQRRAS